MFVLLSNDKKAQTISLKTKDFTNLEKEATKGPLRPSFQNFPSAVSKLMVKQIDICNSTLSDSSR